MNVLPPPLDEELHNIRSVSYPGHPGTYYEQPEPASGLLYCPVLGDVADGSWDFNIDPEYPTEAWCTRCDGWVTAVVDLPARPDRKEEVDSDA
jgi:hypothetical protein